MHQFFYVKFGYAYIFLKWSNINIKYYTKGVIMKNLTEKELGAYNELLIQEKTLIDKFNYYAQNVKDPQLKKLCKETAQKHQEHFNTIFNQIQ